MAALSTQKLASVLELAADTLATLRPDKKKQDSPEDTKDANNKSEHIPIDVQEASKAFEAAAGQYYKALDVSHTSAYHRPTKLQV